MTPPLKKKKSAFSRSPSDTTAVFLVGSGIVLLPLNIVGAYLVWTSERWTRADRIASVLPIVFAVIGIALLNFWHAYRFFWMAAMLGAPVIALYLAFRMGYLDRLRDDELVEAGSS